MVYCFGGNMKDFLTIPVTKKEFWTGFYIALWVVPVLLYFVFDHLMFFAGWLFPIFFFVIFKDELEWDFGIKIKFFEGRE